MTFSLRRASFPCLLVALLGGSLAAGGNSALVRDDAAFFAPETVRKANEEVSALKKQFNVEVRVETIAKVAAAMVDRVRDMNPADKAEYFSGLVQDKVRAAGMDGVFILICKQPGHLQIEIGKETQRRAFTLEDRAKLRELMLARFKAKEFDAGLLLGVGLVRDTLARNLPLPVPVAGRVKDYGDFFSRQAVDRADVILQEIASRFNVPVLFETFTTIAPGKGKGLEAMPPAERTPIYNSVMKERRTKLGRDGLQVLISKHPGHLQVHVGEVQARFGNEKKKVLTPASADKLRDLLLTRFKEKRFDEGLVEGLQFVRDQMQISLGAAAVAAVPPPPPPPVKAPAPVVATVPPAPEVKEKLANANPPTTKPESGSVPVATSASEAKATTAKQADSVFAAAKEKVKEVGETRFPTWMWAVGILAGLVVLWIFIAILRALFGGHGQRPPAEAAPPRVQPMPNPGYPQPAPGAGYPQPAPGLGYQRPPQGGNYPTMPQAGYPVPPQAPAPVQQGRGGGGFVSGALGGALGAAAGSIAYNALHRTGSPAPAQPPYYPGSPQRPSAGGPAAIPGPASGNEGYNTGGDFDSNPAASAAAGGGDFDSPDAPAAASYKPGEDLGGGGEFGNASADEATQRGSGEDPSGGGDWGSGSQAASNSDPAPSDGGGDFSTEAPASGEVASNDAGSDFGADTGSSGGDVASKSPDGDFT